MRQGRYVEGKAVLLEGIPLCRTTNNVLGLSHFLTNLGGIHIILGELPEAVAALTEALAICQQLNNPHVELVVQLNLAEVHYKQGAFASAVADATAGLALAEKLGEMRMQARMGKLLAVAQHGAGETAVGWSTITTALVTAQETASPPVILDVLDGVGVLWVAEGALALARPLLGFIAHHPAAESQHRENAERLLTHLGGSVPPTDERELEAVVAESLVYLKAKTG